MADFFFHSHRANVGHGVEGAWQPKPEPDPVIAPELAEAAGTLASPEDVHRALSKIFHLLAEDRISLKKAGVFCFLSQNILRAQREIAIKQKSAHGASERLPSRLPRAQRVVCVPCVLHRGRRACPP